MEEVTSKINFADKNRKFYLYTWKTKNAFTNYKKSRRRIIFLQ